MRDWGGETARFLAVTVACFVAVLTTSAQADISISLIEPLVQEGKTMVHKSSILKIKGEVYASVEVQQVTIIGSGSKVIERTRVDL